MRQHLPFRFHTAHCAHSTARHWHAVARHLLARKQPRTACTETRRPEPLSQLPAQFGFLHGACGKVELCWALPVLMHSCCSEYNTAQPGMHHAAASAKRIKHPACSQRLRSRQLACSMVRTKKHAAETSRGQAYSQAPDNTPTAHACTAKCRRRQAVPHTLVVGQPAVCALQLHMCCQTATGSPPSHVCPQALTSHPPTQTPGGTLALVYIQTNPHAEAGTVAMLLLRRHRVHSSQLHTQHLHTTTHAPTQPFHTAHSGQRITRTAGRQAQASANPGAPSRMQTILQPI